MIISNDDDNDDDDCGDDDDDDAEEKQEEEAWRSKMTNSILQYTKETTSICVGSVRQNPEHFPKVRTLTFTLTKCQHSVLLLLRVVASIRGLHACKKVIWPTHLHCAVQLFCKKGFI